MKHCLGCKGKEELYYEFRVDVDVHNEQGEPQGVVTARFPICADCNMNDYEEFLEMLEDEAQRVMSGNETKKEESR